VGAAGMMLTSSDHFCWKVVLGLLIGAGPWPLFFMMEAVFHQTAWVRVNLDSRRSLGRLLAIPVLIALMAAVFSGALIGIAVMGIKKQSMILPCRLVPFLFVGLLTAMSGDRTTQMV